MTPCSFRSGASRPGIHASSQERAAVGLMMPAAVLPRPQSEDLRRMEYGFGRLLSRRSLLVGDLDMRHGIDQLFHKIVLSALHECRHGDGKPDTDGNAEHGNKCLPAAAGNMGDGDLENQPHQNLTSQHRLS
ncbi:hypothetical protein ACVJBD_004864 [Rhizobium mongolense]